MDLTNLRDSLDSSSRERHPAMASAKKSELRLTKDFKAAALQLTTLYRTSLSSSKRSYAAGYSQSLTDILDVVLLRLQQPANSAPGFRSTGEGSEANAESDREELRWLVRYLRARVEAIKAESEEDDKDESDEDGVVEENRSGSSNVEVAAHGPAQGSHNSAHEDHTHRADTGRGGETDMQQAAHSEVSVQASQDATVFSFTAPVTSATAPSTSKHRRQRVTGAAPPTVAVVPPTPSSVPSRPFVRASSSSEEDDAAHAAGNPRGTNPTRRALSRPGKRMSGRDKSSGLELFARAQHAKRRRGMGDRKDDDFRDDGLL